MSLSLYLPAPSSDPLAELRRIFRLLRGKDELPKCRASSRAYRDCAPSEFKGRYSSGASQCFWSI
jgi:hypothetical protein